MEYFSFEWYKNFIRLPACEQVIQNDVIPVLEKNQSYPYLGHDFYIDNKYTTQTADLITEFKENLRLLHKSLLPISAKLEAINIGFLHGYWYF